MGERKVRQQFMIQARLRADPFQVKAFFFQFKYGPVHKMRAGIYIFKIEMDNIVSRHKEIALLLVLQVSLVIGVELSGENSRRKEASLQRTMLLL